MDTRPGLDDVEKRKFLNLPGLELRPLGRPASRYTDCAIPAPYCTWNELKLVVNKNQEKIYFLDLLQQRPENVWPLLSRDNTRSATNQGKRQIRAIM
jgi:hypothetical protein